MKALFKTRKSAGLPEGVVKLSPYTSDWVRLFRNERRRLRRCLADRPCCIEHIGSTAVPGLPAKPVIDIAVRIRPRPRLARLAQTLESAGYEYKGEYGLPGRHFFVRGNPVTHHLHIVFRDEPHWVRWLVFRDYLKGHPEELRNYAALKQLLAKRFARQRATYTRSKTAFVTRILAAALLDSAHSKKVKKAY